MNPAVIILLSCLLICAQAQPGTSSSKCRCGNSFVGKVSPHLLKTKPVVSEPNIFCDKTEIIVIIANKEKCVNPQSKLGKLILTNRQKQVTRAAAISSTVSTQTWSLTTSKL